MGNKVMDGADYVGPGLAVVKTAVNVTWDAGAALKDADQSTSWLMRVIHAFI